MGIEARYVAAATPVAAESATDDALSDLTTLLGLSPSGDGLTHQCLEIHRPTGNQKIRFEGPLELRSVACDCLHPLPPLVAARTTLKGFRALALQSDSQSETILLLDIQALLSD